MPKSLFPGRFDHLTFFLKKLINFQKFSERQQKKKKGRFDKTKGRLRKAGFDIDEISRDNMIEMQPKFKEIAEEQLRETKVSPVVPNSEHFTELPYME